MNRFPHIVLAVLPALCFTAPRCALAQPALPSPIFEEGKSYEEATREAKAKHRLLMVYTEGTDPVDQAEFERRTLKNPTLWAFVHWYCIGIKLPNHQGPAKITYYRRGSRPTVTMYIDGELVPNTIHDEIDTLNLPDTLQLPGGPPANNFIAPHRLPTPLKLLFQADFGIRFKSARDPVWGMLHQRDCPEPLAPAEPEPLSNTNDGLAPKVFDPRPDETAGPLDRLDEARRLVKSGDLYQATGVYTWLWERAAALDPAFRPARMSILAQEMASLGAKRDGARERFAKLRNVRTERMLWADYSQMHEWFVLNAINKDPAPTIEFLDYFTSGDEGAMLPPADNAAYNLLTRRTDYGAAWERPKEPLARAVSLTARLSPHFPSQVTPKERDEYGAFARQYLLDEGCRLYAASLVKGDDVTAQQIALAILKARDDAVTRLSLITTALSADPPQPRPIQVRWLDEAEAASGAKRPDLRNRLTLGIHDPPPP
jgi:hypothetical protein